MRLADYTSEDRYFEFDPNTGVYSRIKLPVPRKDCVGYSGMAQLLRSPGEGKILVAKYLSSGDAWFSIGAEKWKLFDDAVVLKHSETLDGFLCELSLHQEGRCIKRFRYLRRDWCLFIIDSTYDYLDFSLAHLPLDLGPMNYLRFKNNGRTLLGYGLATPRRTIS